MSHNGGVPDGIPPVWDSTSLIDFSSEVADARASGMPIVALESTIIAHGMPYPANVKTARLLEATVRENGAVPATIAILGGRFKIGLSGEELEFLAKATHVRKASRADLPGIMGKRENAAVTVAGTMIGAALAGISIFATGGIGGVHRGAEKTFDISADLEELSMTPVSVVSAGAKAILDLPLTLEYLETRGVPVVGFGTEEFPAFYYRESGLTLNERVDNPEEAARLIDIKRRLGLAGGVLFANPIPTEAALEREMIEKAIARAISDAHHHGISGKKITPYLLGRLNEITDGKSLAANVALVKNNAAVAARIAVALANLK
ncbi:MAG: pseudouridine-5'-phosphate glycosidase [Candidatus Riflebacteria bacterium]|nr:pseudouridine-5'-phosphate glycosidase [Candidatus Riflebacteria bacterium]